jgi:hypothetical protein
MAIRNYFRQGILPKKGIVCEVEDHMFLNRTAPILDEALDPAREWAKSRSKS